MVGELGRQPVARSVVSAVRCVSSRRFYDEPIACECRRNSRDRIVFRLRGCLGHRHTVAEVEELREAI